MNLDSPTNQEIELRGLPCPINFIRCRLALEELNPLDLLQVDLDRGEPEMMVISGLKKEGHQVEIVLQEDSWIRLNVICGSC